jgi:hypothetical protein
MGIQGQQHRIRLCDGSATDLIARETCRVVAAALPQAPAAIVLTGSMARSEATCVEDGPILKVLGDAEFLVIFARDTDLPPASAMRELARAARAAVLGSGMDCPIDLGAVHVGYLQSLKPHIFGYELKVCGRVVWGATDILAAIPGFSSDEIPVQEGLELLCNRMIEQLGAAGRAEAFPAELGQGLEYATVKLYLDMTTSLLLHVGRYAPTYEARARNLRDLAESQGGEGRWPFPLEAFSQRVSACLDHKLGRRALPHNQLNEFWEESVRYARSLWCWELSRTMGAQECGENALWARWMRSQPVGRRARGWLYAVRSCGWWRSWREWPRWLKMARITPRLWIYHTGATLLFQLPEITRGKELPKLNELAQGLPLRPAHGIGTWRDLSAAVFANYQRLLMGTRS